MSFACWVFCKLEKYVLYLIDLHVAIIMFTYYRPIESSVLQKTIYKNSSKEIITITLLRVLKYVFVSAIFWSLNSVFTKERSLVWGNSKFYNHHFLFSCFSWWTMSSSTKRKHVYAEVLQSELRVPTESQEIVRVVAGRGNNLHEVESATEGTFLVTMPSKFRKNVWVKRGDYILVERIPEGDKVWKKHLF